MKWNLGILCIAGLWAGLPAMAVGQNRTAAEVGTSVGITVQSVGGSTLTAIGAPGAGILGQPTIYATFFPSEAVMVEPQIALTVLSSGGSTISTVGLGAQIGYLFAGPEVKSGFLAGTVGFQRVAAGGSSNSDLGVGGKVGYRVLVGTGLAVRVEGGLRRWLDTEVNEITIGVGIGGIARASSPNR